MPGFREDEFFDFNRNFRRMKFGQKEVGDIDGQSFNQFPGPILAEVEQPFGNRKIIDGFFEIIARGGRGEVVGHFDVEEQTLRLGAFLLRDTNPVKHFQLAEGDYIHITSRGRGSYLLRDGAEEDSGGCVQGEVKSVLKFDPAVFLGLRVEAHVRFARDFAGIIQEHEMGVPIKFARMDAVLDEDKANGGNVEVGFLLDFTLKCGGGRFAGFDFPPWDAPEIGPFMGSHHEDLARVIIDQSPHCDDGMFLGGSGWSGENVPVVAFEKLP
jgi:hypothetical protein